MRYSSFAFVENTISNSSEVAKFLGSDRLLFYNHKQFGSFKNTFVKITSLSEFHFLDADDLFCRDKRDFYELRQQHKQSKIMAMNEASPDTYS